MSAIIFRVVMDPDGKGQKRGSITVLVARPREHR